MAFWKHGLKGKSFNSDEVSNIPGAEGFFFFYVFVNLHIYNFLHLQVTQEITDESRVFKVLGTNRFVTLTVTYTENSNLFSSLHIII